MGTCYFSRPFCSCEISYDAQGFMELVWVLKQSPFLVAYQGSHSPRVSCEGQDKAGPRGPQVCPLP